MLSFSRNNGLSSMLLKKLSNKFDTIQILKLLSFPGFLNPLILLARSVSSGEHYGGVTGNCS